MKSPLVFALFAALAPLASVNASELNYNFVEVGAVVTESSASGPSVQGSGYHGGFGAGLGYGFISGDISDVELDSADEVTIRSLQLGGRYPLVQSEQFMLDINAALSWESFTLEDASSSDTDAGVGGRLGLRAQIGQRFDAGVFVGAADLDDDISLLHYGVVAQIHMSEHFAISFRYRLAELEGTAGSTVDTDQTSLSARILF
jgi:hypothetical protein